jgi:hypothetical protein
MMNPRWPDEVTRTGRTRVREPGPAVGRELHRPDASFKRTARAIATLADSAHVRIGDAFAAAATRDAALRHRVAT